MSADERPGTENPGSERPGTPAEEFEAVYAQLHAIAGRLFRSQAPGHTLQPTAVLHEAYLKLAGGAGRDAARWQDRAHFVNLAARAMRQVLVNHARDRSAHKRGGGEVPWRRITLDPHLGADLGRSELDLIHLDDELARLAGLDERQARIVELRVFGGLSHPEIAELLEVSLRTVELDWKMARSWLATRFGDGPS